MPLNFLNNGYFAGTVGIGTNSPGEKLAVKGDASYIEITHPTATSYSGIKFSEGGTPQGSIQNIGSTFATVARRGNFEIFHNTGGNLTLQHSGGNVGIGTTSPGSKLVVTSNTSNNTQEASVKINHSRSDADAESYALHIDANLSGADTTTADRTNRGIFLDLDSSADGDASNEHRIRGVNSDVRFTGFSDVVQSGYFLAESNNSTGKTALLMGLQAQASHDSNSTSGGVSNMYGVYGVSSIQDLGDVDHAYGGLFIAAIPSSRGAANVGITKGVEGKVSIDKPDTITYGAMTAVSGIIDNNETTFPTFGDQYLFKGDYQGTRGGSAYGVYCEGDKHYFEGNVGIGTTDPSELLHLESTEPLIRLDDTNSGIHYIFGQDGDGFKFTTNNPTYGKYTFDSNVGIGTTLPDFKLDVDGTLGVSDLPFNSSSVSVLVADETIGAELITNGDFATATDWSLQNAGSTISGGKLNQVSVPNGQNVYQTTGIVVGNTYKVVMTISGYSSGGVRALLGSTGTTATRSANGTFLVEGIAAGNTTFYIQAIGTTTLSIDNVSVKQVTSASDQIQKRELSSGAFGDELWAVTPTDSNDIYNLNSGNVGIGNDDPGYKLQVGDNGVADGNIAMKANGTGANSGAELTFNMNVGGGFADSYIAQIVPISYDSLSSGTHNSLNFKVGTWNNDADAGDSRMTILSNGNIGIGTTDPGNFRLNVNGDSTSGVLSVKNAANGRDTFRSENAAGTRTVNVGNDGSGHGNILIRNSSGTTTNYISGSGYSYFNGGNVGIGTTTPLSKLTIDAPVGDFANGANAISLNYDGGASPGDVGGGIVFSQKWWSASTGQQVTGGIYGIKNAGNGSYGGGLGFYTQPNGASAMAQHMAIRSTGEVGIGTDSPGSKFEVYGGNAGDNDIDRYVRFKASNGEKRFDFYVGGTGNASSLGMYTSDGTTKNVQIASGGTSYFNGGSVGIGVTSPDTKLHVFEAGTAMIRVDSGSTAPYKAGIEFLRSSINGGRIYNDGNNVQVKLESDFAYDAANPTRGGFMFKTAPVTSAILVDAVRIDARGYVGIGTTLPSEKLEVAGNAVINGDLSVSNSFIDSNGNSGSSGQVLTSTSSGTSWSGASGNINTPTQLNLSLGEGYASNVREFLYRNRYRVSPANLSYRYALHFENPSMPEPSIELLPIGGRPGGGLINTAAAGLLFNISPRSTTLNTNGIFKTQRGTTATVVGSDQYIDIVDINEPRIDFTETTTGDFLMEPSSTNRTVSSVDFSTSSWSVDGVTIASFEGDAPDGSDEASTITEISGDTGRHSCFQVVSSSTSLINTFSFFAKYNGTAQFISIVLSNTTTWNSQFVVDLKNGVITKEASPSSSFTNTNKLEKHGDGWYRLISTIEGDFAGDNIYSRIVMSNVAVPPYPPLNTYTGRNNYNILIWGAQLEEQAFATSFIPTTTATVTRGAEISQGVQSYHGTYSSGNPQGTLFAEMSALGDNDNPAYNVDTKISLSNTANTFDNYVTIGFSRFDGNVFAEITSGGTLQTVNFGATGVDKTKMNKYALAWNDGFMRFFVNGVQTNSEHVSAPNINTLQFSAAVTSSQRFQGRVKSLKVYKEMLTPEQLGTLSSWSSFDEMALSQNYTIY